MCFVCTTVAATLLVTSQFAPVEAISAAPVVQKTLTSYSSNSASLSNLQKSEIQSVVEANPDADKFICTGIRLATAPVSENVLVRKRARAACDYAQALNPKLSVWFQNKPTTARSFAGKVLITVKHSTVTTLPTTNPGSDSGQGDLSTHPSITNPSQLSPVEVCKTSDVSPRPDTSNGFPRPATAMTGTVSARILLVPIIFSDLPYTEADDLRMKTATDKVTRFYQETSYGRVSLTYEYLPKQYWVSMSKSAADYRLPENIPQYNKTFLVEDVFALADPAINFSLYDGVALTTGYSSTINGGQGFPGMAFDTKNGIAKGVSLELGSAAANNEVMAHELGHSLFGLEDLYVFLNANRPTVPDPVPAGPWDMMSSLGKEFFGWNKLLMGWLDSHHVRCISNQVSSSHFIETIDKPGSKPKLVLINLSQGVTLAIEGRTSPSKGVLVYKIDTRINHGDGPIIAQKSLLSAGQQLTMEGWTIKVVAIDTSGILIDVVKN
jgi:M6 family metalloprotease-like protein